jgi:hypothetical protein
MLMQQKLAFVALAVLFSVSVNSQLKKGNKMVGVSVGSAFFNSSSTDFSSSIGSSTTSNDNFGVNLNPSIGWFVSDNIAVGIMPSLGYSKIKELGKSSSGNTYLKNETSQFNFSIGGFARYYFKGANEKMRLFGQYNLSVGMGGSKTDGYEYERLGVYVDRYNRKSSGDFTANTGVLLGASKFLNNHIALDFFVGYNFSFNKSNPKGSSLRDYTNPATGDETQEVDYDQKVTGNNVVLGVGFQIFLEKKK